MLNIIALQGRLVADPELRSTPNGINTTTFTIACERNFSKPGEQKTVDFFDIVAWRGTAEFLCKYFRKGQLIAVNGSLQTRSYVNKDGENRKVHEIIAEHINFCERANISETTEQTGLDIDDEELIDDEEELPF